MKCSELCVEERTSEGLVTISKLTPALQLACWESETAIGHWNAVVHTQPEPAGVRCASFYWITLCSIRMVVPAPKWKPQQKQMASHHHTPVPFDFTRAWLMGYNGISLRECSGGISLRGLSDSVTDQLKSTLSCGLIPAMCSKFIVRNVQGSFRKLYNCKAFRKTCSDADSWVFGF